MLAFRPKGKAFCLVIRPPAEWRACGGAAFPSSLDEAEVSRQAMRGFPVDHAITINRFLNSAEQTTVNSKDWPLGRCRSSKRIGLRQRQQGRNGGRLGGKVESGGQAIQVVMGEPGTTDEPKKGKAGMAQDRDVTALKREAERLREQLAAEKERVRTLETANNSVVKRLDAAIESVKAMLSRQG
jgi:hypothetical protein